MKIKRIVAISCASIAALTPLVASSAIGDAAERKTLEKAKSGSNGKLGPWLSALNGEYLAAQKSRGKKATASTSLETKLPAVRLRNGMVSLEGIANDGPALQMLLTSLGANEVRRIGNYFSANLPLSALSELGSAESLRYATPSVARTRVASQGQVVGQGDLGVNAPAARALDSGYDGSGVRIGILSDSFECGTVFEPGAPNATPEEDKANEDIDPDVEVLDNGGCPGSDEGRGMANLIKDVAPGSPQSFHTAFNSRLDFGLGILELAGVPTIFSDGVEGLDAPSYDIPQQKSDVIVDDVIYFVEPMFSPGVVAQAANKVAEEGVPYFSSAGNNAKNSYESNFEPAVRYGNNGRKLQEGRTSGPSESLRHDFDPGDGVDDTLSFLAIPDSTGAAITVFSFQWDQPHVTSTGFALALAGDSQTPAAAATSDVDFLIYDRNGILVPFCPEVGLAAGITCQLTGVNNIGGDAVELAALVYAGQPNKGPEEFQISIVVSGGDAPGRIKWVPFDFAGSIQLREHDTQSGTAYGHSNGENVASVAAAAFYFTEAFDGNEDIITRIPTGSCTVDSSACLEDFSSTGNIPILLDEFGSRLDTPLTPDNPRFTGVDGSNTSFFGFDSSFDDDNDNGKNSPFSTFVTPELDEVENELPNFFGTSASAPNVAAVAALMLQKNPGLSPEQIYQILSDTSRPVSLREAGYDDDESGGFLLTDSIEDVEGRPGFNYESGHGLVDAEAAILAVPDPF
ncbi:MAG: S8 family serine peptidase [Halioglobus sp.]